MVAKKTLPLLLVATILPFAGCLDSDSTDGGDDAAIGEGDDPTANATAVLDPLVYEGDAWNLAIFCSGENSHEFEDDVGGWTFEFAPDNDNAYFAWQNDGDPVFVQDSKTGKVPANASGFYVCNEDTGQTPLMATAYTMTLTPPEPEPAEADLEEDEEDEG